MAVPRCPVAKATRTVYKPDHPRSIVGQRSSEWKRKEIVTNLRVDRRPENFLGERFQGGKKKSTCFQYLIRDSVRLTCRRELFEIRQITAWMGFLGRGWKTNRKGRTVMECHGLGIWILIRCEQGNWAEGNFEGSRGSFQFHLSFFYYANSWYLWTRGISIGIQDSRYGILALANLLFHRWSKHLATHKTKDQSRNKCNATCHFTRKTDKAAFNVLPWSSHSPRTLPEKGKIRGKQRNSF